MVFGRISVVGQDYLLNKGDFDKAIADLTEAIRLDPKSVDSHTFRGLAYRDRGEYDKAITDFTEVSDSTRKTRTHFSSRGWTYWEESASTTRRLPTHRGHPARSE